MFSDPLAYFLTWTCYGTRLHGDERGTVDRTHNQYGEATLPRNNTRRELAERILAHEPHLLGPNERPIVELAIRNHCQLRRWAIHSLNVRTTHAYIVVTASRYTPELAMDQLKSWGTRRLCNSGLLGATTQAWTSHGSTVYVWDEEGLFEVINYVANRQGVDLDEPLPPFRPTAKSLLRPPPHP